MLNGLNHIKLTAQPIPKSRRINNGLNIQNFQVRFFFAMMMNLLVES